MSTSPSSAASRGDRVAVAHVEHPTFDAGDRRSLGDGGRGGRDAAGIPAGEQHAVLWAHAAGQPFGQRAAESLIGPCDECNS